MVSISRRHSWPSSTGVLPVFTTCFGPRTAEAGFVGTTWPVISQSNSIRTAASCCFTPGAAWVCCECLYIGRNVMRPDRRQRQAAIIAPGEEPAARPRIGAPRVRVADVGGEEFHIAPAGGVAGIGDQRRHQRPIGVSLGREGAGRDDGGELRGHGNRRCKVRKSRTVTILVP